MVSGTTSLIGRTASQNLRLRNLNLQLQDLQRQLSSQKKHASFTGFDTEAFRIQDLRATSDRISVYQNNIDRVKTRVELTLDSVTQIRDIAAEVEDSILIQTREGEVDIERINTIADANLRFLQDLLNTQDGTRNILAGTDSQTPPFESFTNLINNFDNEISDWLDGTQTVNDLFTNVENFTDTDLGLSASLSSAGSVSTRIDEQVTVDFSVLANEEGFKNIIKGLALAQAVQFPDEAVDIGTESEFHQILNQSVDYIRTGVDQLQDINARVSSELNLILGVEENNARDFNLAEGLIAEKEQIDTAEAIVNIQNLETQLTASYEVTRLTSELSLVNFL
jgi:flagellar hook-associated protein 3 FlgL